VQGRVFLAPQGNLDRVVHGHDVGGGYDFDSIPWHVTPRG